MGEYVQSICSLFIKFFWYLKHFGTKFRSSNILFKRYTEVNVETLYILEQTFNFDILNIKYRIHVCQTSVFFNKTCKEGLYMVKSP